MSLLSDTTGFFKVLGYPVAYLKGFFDGKSSAEKKVEKQNEKIRKIARRRYDKSRKVQVNKKNNSSKKNNRNIRK